MKSQRPAALQAARTFAGLQEPVGIIVEPDADERRRIAGAFLLAPGVHELEASNMDATSWVCTQAMRLDSALRRAREMAWTDAQALVIDGLDTYPDELRGYLAAYLKATRRKLLLIPEAPMPRTPSWFSGMGRPCWVFEG
jgi:hypothetical protein